MRNHSIRLDTVQRLLDRAAGPQIHLERNILICKLSDMSTLAAPFRLPRTPARSDLVAKYFRGLGDPTRLRILEELRQAGELSVGELVERLGVPQPKISNHLACLRWCGFVETRRDHRVVFNRVADARVETMLDLAQALLDDNAEHVAACCRIDQQ
jgi:ArsR family transcriptional regulator, cadmium/lead-responsive transcriptional repressor